MTSFGNETSNRQFWVQVFKIVAIAVILGPPTGGFVLGIGHLVLTIVVTIRDFVFDTLETSANSNWWSIVFVPFLYAMWSYVFGVFPAIGSSIMLAAHVTLYEQLSLRLVFLYVTLSTIASGILIFGRGSWTVSYNTLFFFGIYLCCGLVSAWLLWCWFGNSFSNSGINRNEPQKSDAVLIESDKSV